MENLKTKCCNSEVRWADCEDCREVGKTCDLLICCNCGDEISDGDLIINKEI